MPPLYVIPGLGTDTRIFSRWKTLPFMGVEWLEPMKNESLREYAKRMAQSIKHPNPVLIGVSFGGVLAQEIASFLPVKGVILISSIKSEKELPHSLRIMRFVPFYQLSKGQWRIQTLPLWGRLFGIHEKEERNLIMDMFRKQTDSYRMWAIRNLVHWEASPYEGPLIHIHGTMDRVFPYQRILSCIPVEKGDHFMVYRKADEVEAIVKSSLIGKILGRGQF